MDTHIENIETEVVDAKRDMGFTLIELLIVIVILGILATVTVFAVRGITDTGQQNSCKADKKTLEVAVEAWYAQNPTGDPTEAGLVADELLRAESDLYDVGAAGAVNAVAGGECVGI